MKRERKNKFWKILPLPQKFKGEAQNPTPALLSTDGKFLKFWKSLIQLRFQFLATFKAFSDTFESCW
jgi:hypothetical protein